MSECVKDRCREYCVILGGPGLIYWRILFMVLTSNRKKTPLTISFQIYRILFPFIQRCKDGKVQNYYIRRHHGTQIQCLQRSIYLWRLVGLPVSDEKH